MKTLIAVPCMDQVAAPFAHSLASLNKKGECLISFQISSLIYQSRNDLAKQALKAGADYILYLDSDMTFPQDTLTKLIQHMEEGKDIVTGLCFRRRPPFTPAIFKKLGVNEDGLGTWEGYDDYPHDTVFEVGGCGFACVMVKTTVMMDVMLNHRDLFGPTNGFGEDLSFCIRAKDCGYKIYCDSTIKTGHIGQIVVDENFYMTARSDQREVPECSQQ